MISLNKYIDHTALKSATTEEEITKLCREAAEYGFASVCINPCNIPLAKKLLEGTDVKVCTVIGFPLGANTTAVKAFETRDAYQMGCDEFDMVINVAALKDGKNEYIRNEIKAVVAETHGKCVKVIIETGLLTDEEKITAVKLSCEAGASFVKTCTGFTEGKALPADVKLMHDSISGSVKVKASAGIRNYEDAQELINAGAERLGTSAGISIIKGTK